MLILIGCAPTAYALNRTMPESATPAFVSSVNAAAGAFAAHASPAVAPVDLDASRAMLTGALKTRHADTPQVYGAADSLSRDVAQRIAGYGSLDKVPAAATPNLRNDMYLLLDSARLATKDKEKAAKTFNARPSSPRSRRIRPISRKVRATFRCG